MPLHVFISQSFSLVTGGIEVWKAAKDVLLFVAGPFLLFLSYKRGLFKDKTFRLLLIFGAMYAVLHGLFVLFDGDDDTYSAIVGSVYNTRLLIYLLIGYLVGSAKNGKKYLKYLLTVTVLVASVVSVLGILQYFLPSDLLTHVGYSLERGVKPLFFIDDNPDLPRIMSTLKDPNSLGSYLIIPILLTGLALFKKESIKKLFSIEFKRWQLAELLCVQLIALFLTFSRGALLGLIIGALTLVTLLNSKKVIIFLKNYWYIPLISLVILVVAIFSVRDTPFIQDYVFHAAKTTNEEDPNQKRVTLVQDATEDIIDEPFGYGPGSAGLVSITNPKGGVLTENYYLQIAYEVGWLGLATFIAILSVIAYQLFLTSSKSSVSAVLLSALVAYLFYSLLIHLWSNEAVSLQWWLPTGVVLGLNVKKNKIQR